MPKLTAEVHNRCGRNASKERLEDFRQSLKKLRRRRNEHQDGRNLSALQNALKGASAFDAFPTVVRRNNRE